MVVEGMEPCVRALIREYRTGSYPVRYRRTVQYQLVLFAGFFGGATRHTTHDWCAGGRWVGCGSSENFPRGTQDRFGFAFVPSYNQKQTAKRKTFPVARAR